MPPARRRKKWRRGREVPACHSEQRRRCRTFILFSAPCAVHLELLSFHVHDFVALVEKGSVSPLSVSGMVTNARLKVWSVKATRCLSAGGAPSGSAWRTARIQTGT